MKVLLILLVVLLNSCRGINEQPIQKKEQAIEYYIKAHSPYVLDESIDIFLKRPWYVYDESNHIIWPNFQVYALKTKGTYYKLQIVDYYRKDSRPGFYTLRLQKEGENIKSLNFDAQGCGNVYTNLQYKECIKNPSLNVYTYLNVETLDYWKMSNEEAKENELWDIAFNGTEVKINSGFNGPGKVRIGDLYLYEGFFNQGVAEFQRIATVSFGDKGLRFFNLDFDLRQVAFALPPGVERVVSEEDWYQKDQGFHTPVTESWWILKAPEFGSFFKFHIKEIIENKIENEIHTTIILEFYSRDKNTNFFSLNSSIWSLPKFTSRQRLIKWCLDFDDKRVVNCQLKSKWDLKFSASNRRGKRKWRFNVNQGAIGPLIDPSILRIP